MFLTGIPFCRGGTILSSIMFLSCQTNIWVACTHFQSVLSQASIFRIYGGKVCIYRQAAERRFIVATGSFCCQPTWRCILCTAKHAFIYVIFLHISVVIHILNLIQNGLRKVLRLSWWNLQEPCQLKTNNFVFWSWLDWLCQTDYITKAIAG